MRRQHSKGKKRPRRWHHGRAQGVRVDRVMRDVVESAFARAEARTKGTAADLSRLRADILDWQELIDGLAHVSPFAPAF